MHPSNLCLLCNFYHKTSNSSKVIFAKKPKKPHTQKFIKRPFLPQGENNLIQRLKASKGARSWPAYQAIPSSTDNPQIIPCLNPKTQRSSHPDKLVFVRCCVTVLADVTKSRVQMTCLTTGPGLEAQSAVRCSAGVWSSRSRSRTVLCPVEDSMKRSSHMGNRAQTFWSFLKSHIMTLQKLQQSEPNIMNGHLCQGITTKLSYHFFSNCAIF